MKNFTRICRTSDDWYNFLKPDGTLLSKEWFECANDFREGFARVLRADGCYNFLKPDGSFLSEEWFWNAWDFRKGFAKVQREDGLWYKLATDGTLSKLN